MESLVRLCSPLLLLLLLLFVASATSNSLSENFQQSFNLEANRRINFRGSILNGYTHDGVTMVEPYMAFNVAPSTAIRRDVFNSGFYVKLPIRVSSSRSLTRLTYKPLSLRSFSVVIRSGFASSCKSKCPSVSASGIRTRRGFAVVFRCRQRATCVRVVQALRHTTPETEIVRKAFAFRFDVRAAGKNFVLTKKGLPVYRRRGAVKNAFWFEPNRLLLYTVVNRSGYKFLPTLTRKGHSRIPSSGLLPRIYRSNDLDKLPELVAKTRRRFIVVEMRRAGRKVSQLKFRVSSNAKSLTSTNWFSKSRLVSSFPYNIKSMKTNFFSVAGHAQRINNLQMQRRLFVNFNYVRCPQDRGFIEVSDSRDPCRWSNRFWNGKAPLLLYNPRKGATWLKAGKMADRLLIYLQ